MNNRLIFLFMLGIISCGPSDEELLSAAKLKTQQFVDELMVENYYSANEIYPDFSQIGRYYIPTNYSIKGATFTTTNNDEVKIMGDFLDNEERKSLQFTLRLNNNGEWSIIKSKGLSSYNGSPLFRALLKSECFDFSDLESDAVVHTQCDIYAQHFEDYTQEIKKLLEELISSDTQQSNIRKSPYTSSISGEIILKNSSEINFPAFCFDVYFKQFNSKGEVLKTTKLFQQLQTLDANGGLYSIPIYDVLEHGSDSWGISVVITNDNFIREWVASGTEFPCSY